MINQETKVLIIGGGVHGTALAAKFSEHGMRSFLIVDDQGLLKNWERLTSKLVHKSLRTPNTAHIDPRDAKSLCTDNSFLQRMFCDERKPARLASFNKRSKKVIERYDLQSKFRQGRVVDLHKCSHCGIFTAHVAGAHSTYTIQALRVVVAVGIGSPRMLPGNGSGNHRVFTAEATNVIKELPCATSKIAVVGGGLTGATLAANFAEKGADVTLFHRGQITSQQLEVSSGWTRDGVDRYLFDVTFHEHHKKGMLRSARKRSTVTPAAEKRLYQSRCRLVTGTTVLSWEADENSVSLKTPLATFGHFDYVIFSLGYKSGIDRLKFLKRFTFRTEDGRPHLYPDLESKDVEGLFFMGYLAELQLGPLGRNIPGAIEGSNRVVFAR